MMFEFHPDALDEYKAAAHYYAACQTGLEQLFIRTVEHSIQQVVESPSVGGSLMMTYAASQPWAWSIQAKVVQRLKARGSSSSVT